jgi:GPH family glycoside/pentoside/hexuronide:cation symporter
MNPTPVQPESALNAIRLFVGPIPAILLIVSMIVIYNYPITREKHAEMRAKLAKRKADDQENPSPSTSETLLGATNI